MAGLNENGRNFRIRWSLALSVGVVLIAIEVAFRAFIPQLLMQTQTDSYFAIAGLFLVIISLGYSSVRPEATESANAKNKKWSDELTSPNLMPSGTSIHIPIDTTDTNIPAMNPDITNPYTDKNQPQPSLGEIETPTTNRKTSATPNRNSNFKDTYLKALNSTANPGADDYEGLDSVFDEETDDLTRIEGIGPKLSEALISAEIKTFKDLAVTDEDQLKSLLLEAGHKFVPSLKTWRQQANLAAKHEWDQLKELQDQLDAGRSKQ